MRMIVVLTALCACAATASQRPVPVLAQEAPGGYRLKVEAEGLPWIRTSGAESQILEVSPEALRIVSEKTGDGIIVRFDKKVIYSLRGGTKTYEEEPLDSLAEMGKERSEDREKKRKRILERARDEEEKERYLKELGLREDGRTVVTLVEPGETKDLGGHTCQAREIRENDLAILRIFEADDLERPRGLFRLFAETGVFSQEIVEKLDSFAGFPLGIELKMDFSIALVHIQVAATSVEAVDLASLDFEIPEGFQLEKEEAGEEALACHICKSPVKKDTPHHLFIPSLGETRLYCTAECRQKGIERIKEEFNRGK
jgi:hypothetical protein